LAKEDLLTSLLTTHKLEKDMAEMSELVQELLKRKNKPFKIIGVE